MLNKRDSEMKKWLNIFKHQNNYKGINDILHLALCCFVKSPLESTAETAGSLINQHGRKSRCSLLPASLSNEIQIAWNGRAEMDPATTSLLKESIAEYFDKKQTGVRFYIYTKIRLMSSAIQTYCSKPSRIQF